MNTKTIYFCYKCGWKGTNYELDVLQTDAVDEDGRYVDYICCPQCGSLEGVLPVEYKKENDYAE